MNQARKKESTYGVLRVPTGAKRKQEGKRERGGRKKEGKRKGGGNKLEGMEGKNLAEALSDLTYSLPPSPTAAWIRYRSPTISRNLSLHKEEKP